MVRKIRAPVSDRIEYGTGKIARPGDPVHLRSVFPLKRPLNCIQKRQKTEFAHSLLKQQIKKTFERNYYYIVALSTINSYKF